MIVGLAARPLGPRPPAQVTRPRVLGVWLWVCSLAIASAAPPVARATTVEELDFLALHERAANLFHGRCLERKEVHDDGPVPYTEYTFEVLEVVKGCRDSQGQPLEKVTFRHAGTRQGPPGGGRVRPDGLEVAPLRLGVPEYDPGDEVVLFLTRESPIGLCAPVGLVQGTFKVTKDKGAAWVSSPVGFRRLLSGVTVSSFVGLRAGAAAVVQSPPAKSEKISLEDFLDLCRKVKVQR